MTETVKENDATEENAPETHNENPVVAEKPKAKAKAKPKAKVPEPKTAAPAGRVRNKVIAPNRGKGHVIVLK